MATSPPGLRPTLRQLLGELRGQDSAAPAVLISIDDTMEHYIDSATTTKMVATGSWAKRFGRDYVDRRVIPLRGDALKVGRGKDCHIRIDNVSASRVHAVLDLDHVAGDYFVTDNESRNGTYVDGVRLRANEPVRICTGAHLGFGDALYVFVEPSALRQLAAIIRSR